MESSQIDPTLILMPQGQSIDSDEWLDAKASSLHDRIVSVSAPQKVRKPRS